MMQSNPLLCEIKAAFADSVSGTPGYPEVARMPRFFGGSAAGAATSASAVRQTARLRAATGVCFMGFS